LHFHEPFSRQIKNCSCGLGTLISLGQQHKQINKQTGGNAGGVNQNLIGRGAKRAARYQSIRRKRSAAAVLSLAVLQLSGQAKRSPCPPANICLPIAQSIKASEAREAIHCVLVRASEARRVAGPPLVREKKRYLCRESNRARSRQRKPWAHARCRIYYNPLYRE
jgi:hypothetical protein